jgi:hypothetical protein
MEPQGLAAITTHGLGVGVSGGAQRLDAHPQWAPIPIGEYRASTAPFPGSIE